MSADDSSGGETDADTSDYGTLYVVGIGPGLPHAMTQRARDVIETADCVIASNLYQEFLRQDGTLPPEAATDGGVATRPTGDEQEIVRSSMGQQIELAREAFERVR
ncbi:MAG: precorrin-3B C17-methyltransferase, partial [Natronomonas sp.]